MERTIWEKMIVESVTLNEEKVKYDYEYLTKKSKLQQKNTVEKIHGVNFV